jgi:hypothetical protein
LAQPQEKSSDRITDLPNPELNPMVNPTLGRNLGRWAQVYFTTPPEKREQAVVELLRELEAENGPLPPPPASASIYELPKRPAALEPAACGECGHPSTPGQRFCGMCGSPLLSEQQNGRARAEILPLAATADAGPAKNVPEHPFPTLSLFAEVLEEPASGPSNGNGTSEIQWLRNKNLPFGFASSSRRRLSKYGFALVGVVLLGLLYYYYANSGRPNASQAASRTVPAAIVTAENQGRPTAPEPAPVPTATQPTPSPAVVLATDPPISNSSAVTASRPATPVTRQEGVAAQAVPGKAGTAPPPEPGTPAIDNGSLELATAQDYLTGKNRPRDSAAAATFLWAAVRKENTTAVLLLSELYLAGDGVPKNCDQARVLLTAAAHKQVAQAVTRLRGLERSGCP